MTAHFINIVLGFIEGFGLIISPCILPILPIFLAASLAGSKKRPLGMIVGFTLFFALLIFCSRYLVNYLGINFDIIRRLSYVILVLLGLIMLSSYLTEKFSQITQGLTRVGALFANQHKKQGGFGNGLLLGGLIAIIWTPCAGPILAAIIVQTVVQQTSVWSFFTLLAFALGAVLPLFVLSWYGKQIMSTFTFFKTRAELLRQCLGAVLIASVVYMMYFANTVVSSSPTQTGIKTTTALIGGLWHPYPEPQIAGISAWINSPALRLNDLKGKVVLIDFWTYSCINCLRSLPYVKDWYRQYHEQGLVVIGIHTPEFDFEKDLENVRAAVLRDGILYPVALDNQFATWLNFNNHYWPAHYLINKQGEVVYEHFGEGDYEITENNIRFLLGIHELATLNTQAGEPVAYSQTPETYLGYARADANLSPTLRKDKAFNYHFPPSLPINAWSLDGFWQANAESIMAIEANAALKLHFKAKTVFVVMGNNTSKPIQVKVRLNRGGEKILSVDKYAIYRAVSQQQFSRGDLEIIAMAPGIKIYTFTFGN